MDKFKVTAVISVLSLVVSNFAYTGRQSLKSILFNHLLF